MFNLVEEKATEHVVIKPSTKKLLDERKKFRQTYDDIITELLKVANA